MNDFNHVIIGFGVATIASLLLIIIIITNTQLDFGCHLIGTEVNGDLTTEYLLIGDC